MQKRTGDPVLPDGNEHGTGSETDPAVSAPLPRPRRNQPPLALGPVASRVRVYLDIGERTGGVIHTDEKVLGLTGLGPHRCGRGSDIDSADLLTLVSIDP